MLELLALGIVISLEPLPLIGFILVLGTDRGIRNGAAFIAGWMATLVVIVVATVALTGGHPPAAHTAPASAIAAVQIVIGLFLLAVAYRVHHRPADRMRAVPKWTKRLDRLTPTGAALLGVALQPWPLVAAGAAAATQADVSNVLTIIALILFCILATLCLLIMEIAAHRSPAATRRKLDALHKWLDRNRDAGVVVLSTVVGVWLAGHGIYTLLA